MGPKPTAKSTRVSKPEAGKPSVRSTRSDNKPESKNDSKSEINETKQLRKDEGEDTSILHPPVDLSGSGLRQVNQIFEKGTTEVQDLLSFECDVIYECKICRNLFRSVANFISHKRIYCTTQYQTSNQLLNVNNKLEEQFNSLDPADAVHPNIVKTKLKNPNRIVPRSNLAAVLNSCVSFPKPVHIRPNRNDFTSNGDHSLLLQSMQGSNAGVFQTYVPNSSPGYPMLMKDQMQELYSAQQEKTKTVVRDFWEVNGDENFGCTNGISDSQSNKTYTCDRCGLPCSSAKTLLRHKKLVHETARTCYLCPCCKSTFPNTWSVHRHLFKVHHKTNEQVRKLRLQIKSKVLQPGEAMKGLSDKMKMVNQKITDQQRWDLENEEWLDQLGKDADLLRCGSCGRKFERRAALKAHYQICQKRVVPVTSTIQYRPTPEKETNPPESKPKSIADNLKLHPVVALTALTPAQIKEKSLVPEKKIGIQVRMDYCKNMTSSANSERTNRLSRFGKPNPIEIITIDDERTIDKPKSCLETLLTGKRNNRSDSGNDSESQDDTSVALDFSSDSVVDEDAIKLNMYDILGINSTDRTVDKALDSSLNMESSNCDEFSNENTVIPNKRKKGLPVKRLVCNVENGLKTVSDSRSELWAEKSNELDCVFRKENAKVTYTNCKLKSNKTELDKVNHLNDPPDSVCPELVEKLANFYNKTNGICLLCNNKFDPVNILRHITEHGNWLKFRCKWPQCEHESSTKTELIKHISTEHRSLEEETVAHDFVELISKKDWKFIVAVSANKYRKKPNLLLKSVNKLKERLNGVGKHTESANREGTSASINASTKLDVKFKADVSNKENDFDEMNVDTDIKAVESMEVDSGSLSEMETVDLNSSIDDKDSEVLSVKSISQNDSFDIGNSNRSAKSNCDIVDEKNADIVNNGDVDTVNEDDVNIINKDYVDSVNKDDVDIVVKDDVNKTDDVNKVEESACCESESILESNLAIIAELNKEILPPKVPINSNEEQTSSRGLSNLTLEKAIPELSTDLNEGNALAKIPIALDEEKRSPEVSTDSNEDKASPTGLSNLNEGEALSGVSVTSSEEKGPPRIPVNSNEGEAFLKVSTCSNEKEISLEVSADSSKEMASPRISTVLNDEKSSATVSTDLNEGGAFSNALTDLNSEKAPPSVSTNLNEGEAFSKVSTDSNKEKASPILPNLNEGEAFFETSTDLNEGTASPKVSTESNEETAFPKITNDSNEEETSKVLADSNVEKASLEVEVVSTSLIEENVSVCPENRMSCDSPIRLYEDDSHCVDMADVDPSCSAFDQSEMEVELDDDHLRAVMMEMIFGGTSNETASSSTSEFVSKNAGSSKKRKLIDAKLNV